MPFYPLISLIVTSAMVLGAFGGSSTAGSLQEGVGRRLTVVLAVCIYLLGVALSFMASTYAVLVAGRLVTGAVEEGTREWEAN